MSLLPQQIPPASARLGTVDQDGNVIADKNYWLFWYNLALQALGSGPGLPPAALTEMASSDTDAADSDAIVLRRPIGNNTVLSLDPLLAAASEYPDLARALLLAQDPPLQDPVPAAQPSAPITPGGSPYTYTAPFSGCVAVTGGTVSAIAIVRQATSVATGLTVGVFQLSRGDGLKVTYSGVPTMIFLPT